MQSVRNLLLALFALSLLPQIATAEHWPFKVNCRTDAANIVANFYLESDGTGNYYFNYQPKNRFEGRIQTPVFVQNFEAQNMIQIYAKDRVLRDRHILAQINKNYLGAGYQFQALANGTWTRTNRSPGNIPLFGAVCMSPTE